MSTSFHGARIDSIESALDTGSSDCSLFVLVNYIRETQQEDRANFSLEGTALRFAGSLEPRARRLAHLISEYETAAARHPHRAANAVRRTVARWIFFTNKLEFAGVESAADTAEVLTKGFCIHQKRREGEKDVIQTFKVLTATYWPKNTNTALEERTFDKLTIQKWHSANFEGYSFGKYAPGQFRKKGMIALAPYPHQYPHHNVSDPAIDQLCTLVHKCAKRISGRFTTASSITLYTVCLAALAQFHFVDIHPFADGNGRICRLISKVIMDHISPLPVPMFRDRDAYIQALVDGRKGQDISHAPLQLASLLFDEAIELYTTENRALKIADYFLCAITEEGLLVQIEGEGLQRHVRAIMDKFQRMPEHEDRSEAIQIQDGDESQVTICIRRLPELSFDDL